MSTTVVDGGSSGAVMVDGASVSVAGTGPVASPIPSPFSPMAHLRNTNTSDASAIVIHEQSILISALLKEKQLIVDENASQRRAWRGLEGRLDRILQAITLAQRNNNKNTTTPEEGNDPTHTATRPDTPDSHPIDPLSRPSLTPHIWDAVQVTTIAEDNVRLSQEMQSLTAILAYFFGQTEEALTITRQALQYEVDDENEPTSSAYADHLHSSLDSIHQLLTQLSLALLPNKDEEGGESESPFTTPGLLPIPIQTVLRHYLQHASVQEILAMQTRSLESNNGVDSRRHFYIPQSSPPSVAIGGGESSPTPSIAGAGDPQQLIVRLHQQLSKLETENADLRRENTNLTQLTQQQQPIDTIGEPTPQSTTAAAVAAASAAAAAAAASDAFFQENMSIWHAKEEMYVAEEHRLLDACEALRREQEEERMVFEEERRHQDENLQALRREIQLLKQQNEEAKIATAAATAAAAAAATAATVVNGAIKNGPTTTSASKSNSRRTSHANSYLTTPPPAPTAQPTPSVTAPILPSQPPPSSSPSSSSTSLDVDPSTTSPLESQLYDLRKLLSDTESRRCASNERCHSLAREKEDLQIDLQSLKHHVTELETSYLQLEYKLRSTYEQLEYERQQMAKKMLNKEQQNGGVVKVGNRNNSIERFNQRNGLTPKGSMKKKKKNNTTTTTTSTSPTTQSNLDSHLDTSPSNALVLSSNTTPSQPSSTTTTTTSSSSLDGIQQFTSQSPSRMMVPATSSSGPTTSTTTLATAGALSPSSTLQHVTTQSPSATTTTTTITITSSASPTTAGTIRSTRRNDTEEEHRRDVDVYQRQHPQSYHPHDDEADGADGADPSHPALVLDHLDPDDVDPYSQSQQPQPHPQPHQQPFRQPSPAAQFFSSFLNTPRTPGTTRRPSGTNTNTTTNTTPAGMKNKQTSPERRNTVMSSSQMLQESPAPPPQHLIPFSSSTLSSATNSPSLRPHAGNSTSPAPLLLHRKKSAHHTRNGSASSLASFGINTSGRSTPTTTMMTSVRLKTSSSSDDPSSIDELKRKAQEERNASVAFKLTGTSMNRELNPSFHDDSYMMPSSAISLQGTSSTSAVSHMHQSKYIIVDATKRVGYLHHRTDLPHSVAARNQNLVGIGATTLEGQQQQQPDTTGTGHLLLTSSEDESHALVLAGGGDGSQPPALSRTASLSTLNTSTTIREHHAKFTDPRTRPLIRTNSILAARQNKANVAEKWYVLGGSHGADGYRDLRPRIDSHWDQPPPQPQPTIQTQTARQMAPSPMGGGGQKNTSTPNKTSAHHRATTPNPQKRFRQQPSPSPHTSQAQSLTDEHQNVHHNRHYSQGCADDESESDANELLALHR